MLGSTGRIASAGAGRRAGGRPRFATRCAAAAGPTEAIESAIAGSTGLPFASQGVGNRRVALSEAVAFAHVVVPSLGI